MLHATNNKRKSSEGSGVFTLTDQYTVGFTYHVAWVTRSRVTEVNLTTYQCSLNPCLRDQVNEQHALGDQFWKD